MSQKAAGLDIISLRVASFLDELKGQDNGGNSQGRSGFWQFLREEMMRVDRTLVEGRE